MTIKEVSTARRFAAGAAIAGILAAGSVALSAVSECTLTGARLPIGAPAPAGQLITVHVGVDCSSDN